MCQVVNEAVRASVSRRVALGGALAGIAGVGAAVSAQADTAAAGARRPPLRARGHRTKLVLLGTGGGPPWYPGSTRQGIASAVSVGDRYYLVDTGEGVGPQIVKARLGNWQSDLAGPLDALRAIFITHQHSDHVCDLSNLMTNGLSNGLRLIDRPIQIWGPGNRGVLPPLFGDAPAPPVVAPENPTPGTVEMVDLLVRAFATDFNDRARDARNPVPDQLFAPFDVPVPEQYLADPNGNPHPRMSPFTFFEDDRVRVSATLVQHAPVFPAFGFRFDTDDGSVVFSGDTSPSENLIELATGADVLVHEVIDATWVSDLFPSPRDPVSEARYNHLISAHTLIDQVGPVAEAAGVRTLVLSHLVPANRPDRTWRPAGAGFSGRLVIGHDLDEIGVRRRRRHDS